MATQENLDKISENNILKYKLKLLEKIKLLQRGKQSNRYITYNIFDEMDLSSMHLTELPRLPLVSKKIICSDNQLTYLPKLPITLTELECNTNLLTTLPELPITLIYLDCGTNQLRTLPKLPEHLEQLYCSINELITLPEISDYLTHLECSNNQLTILPELPFFLKSLSCSNNQLRIIPELSDYVIFIDCNNNKLTTLPELPESLTQLSCSNNQLTTLPELSKALLFIECSNNQLTTLPELPNALTQLLCSANQLTTLPELPLSLQMIDIDENPNLDPYIKKIYDKYRIDKNINKFISNINYYISNINNYLNPERQMGDNHPRTAYIMLGHGRELSEKNIVPKGCMLVVDVHSGEVAYPLINKILSKLENNSILLNPIDNYKEVVNLLSTTKSLAIYKEGDEYPDFLYSLLSFWNSNELNYSGNKKKYYIKDSGIVKYPFKYIPKKKNTDFYDDTESYNELINTYRMSIFPTRQSIIEILPKNINTLKDIVDLANKPYSILYNLITINQSELFNKVTKGELEPGIFYNLICRATDDNIRKTNIKTRKEGLNNAIRVSNINRSIYPINSQAQHNENNPFLNSFGPHVTNIFNNIKYSTSVKTNRNQNRHTRKPKTFFGKEILGAISEAELQRKPFVKKLQLNNRVNRQANYNDYKEYEELIKMKGSVEGIKQNAENCISMINDQQKELNKEIISYQKKIDSYPLKNTSSNEQRSQINNARSQIDNYISMIKGLEEYKNGCEMPYNYATAQLKIQNNIYTKKQKQKQGQQTLPRNIGHRWQKQNNKWVNLNKTQKYKKTNAGWIINQGNENLKS